MRYYLKDNDILPCATYFCNECNAKLKIEYASNKDGEFRYKVFPCHRCGCEFVRTV
ncbi:hypothetical protein FACS18949_13290 [Clostridia bacterium]|nr:hypothetical protein FACS189425_07000 [Clostridia bacterium]GHV35400.1 hypothetical protein FACS18949_13290 [Clostridia bacterium]